jgi:hypothetical protein
LNKDRKIRPVRIDDPLSFSEEKLFSSTDSVTSSGVDWQPRDLAEVGKGVSIQELLRRRIVVDVLRSLKISFEVRETCWSELSKILFDACCVSFGDLLSQVGRRRAYYDDSMPIDKVSVRRIVSFK